MAVRLFASPELLLAITDSHPDYAAYAARLAAVSTPYTAITEVSYAAAVAAYDALDADEKFAVMFNVYENPILEILTARQDSAVPSTWTDGTTFPGLQTEATRQSAGTITGSWTMAQFKTLAVTMYNDLADYATANGSTYVVHYSSPGVSFNNTTGGTPRAGVRASATTASYWGSSVSHPTLASVFDTAANATGNLETLMAGNRGCTADGIGTYTFVPDGETWSDAVDSWTSSTIDRKTVGGVTTTPDFEASMLREWKRRTQSTWCYEYRRGRDTVATNDGSFAADAERDVALIVTPGPSSPDQYGSAYIDRNHWIGLWDGTAQRTAEDLFGSLFLTGNADTPNVTAPEEVWVWAAARYYWVTLPTNDRSASSSGNQKQIDRARCAWEKMFFGRPQNADDENIGVDSPSPSHDTWYSTNNLGDALWYRGNSTAVWRNASGVLHSSLILAGLTIDFSPGGVTEPLAPYFTAGQIAGTEAITQADIEDAIELWVTERHVSVIEAASVIIAEADATETGEPVKPAFTQVADREPYAGMLVATQSGVRPIVPGEMLTSLVDGEDPRIWFVYADGVPIEFVGSGGGGGVSDGDKGDIVVSSTGAVWTIDASAVTTSKIANAAVTGAKMQAGSAANQIWLYSGTAWAIRSNSTNNAINDSSVSGTTVTDALNTLSTSDGISNASGAPGTTVSDALTALSDSDGIDNASGVVGTKVSDALDTLNSGKANSSHGHVPADVTMTNGFAVLGRSSGSGGSATELIPTSTYRFLGYDGTSTGFKTITGDYIDTASIPYTKLSNVAAHSFLVRATGTAGPPDEIAVGTSQLIGRGSSGNVAPISLGSGLSMSGTTLSATGGGTGDVVGPASATDNAVARFDTTTGKLIQNSVVAIDDTGTISGVDIMTANTLSSSVVNCDEINTSQITLDANNGLSILGSASSFYYVLSMTGSPVANRTFSLDLGDADRTLSITGNTTLNGGSHSGTNTGDQSIFQTIAVSGQSNVVADTTTDTLTLAAGAGLAVTTNATTDTVTFALNVSGTIDADTYLEGQADGSLAVVDLTTYSDTATIAVDDGTPGVLSWNVVAGSIGGTQLGAHAKRRTITLSANTGDAATALSTGEVSGAEVIVPVDGTIVRWRAVLRPVTGETTGSVTLDVWKVAATGGWPTNTNTITASAKPSISAGVENTSTTLTGWTTDVTAGDKIVLEVESVTNAYAVTLSIEMEVD